MADTCATCRFYMMEGRDGVCRRNPPLPFIAPASMFEPAKVVPIWPNPTSDLWCGCFEPADTRPTVIPFPQRDPGDENPGSGIK